MSHLFRYPTAAAPTATVTLRPTLTTIQEDTAVSPVQRYLEAPDGTHWVFQLSSNDRQTYDVIVEGLQEADSGGYSGYTTLRAFFATSTNWMATTFELTHSDGGGNIPVRLMQETWSFTEGLKGFWSGRFLLRRVV